MKLTLTILATLVRLHFETPGPGSWYVFEVDATGRAALIVASGSETNACHICVEAPMQQAAFYHAAFFPMP